eukprot:30731-Chlamydomonas_euryale.AAC.3
MKRYGGCERELHLRCWWQQAMPRRSAALLRRGRAGRAVAVGGRCGVVPLQRPRWAAPARRGQRWCLASRNAQHLVCCPRQGGCGSWLAPQRLACFPKQLRTHVTHVTHVTTSAQRGHEVALQPRRCSSP